MNVASSTAWIKLNGHYESTGGTCFMYSIISNVCLQVDKDDGGNWYLNKNKMTGESGCYSQHHNTTQYTQIVLSGGSKIDDVYPYTVGKVTWELRSAYDPWLVAMVLTEDTKNFGMSALELRYIGIWLIIWWAGLTIMPIWWFYTLCKNGSFFYSSKNRRYQYRPENIVGDEETPKGGLSRGIPPRNIGLDKNNIDIIIEGDEPESEREQNLSKLSKSVKQVNKKPARNGEYESYYQ